MIIVDKFIQTQNYQILGKFELAHKGTIFQSRRLLTKMVNIKYKLFLNQPTNIVSYLIDYELFMLLIESSFITNINYKLATTLSLEKYTFGGILMGSNVYYKFNINDNIYCSDTIENIDRYLTIKQRKAKLKQINESNYRNI